MTVLFSKKCEYALQALLFMAEYRHEGPLSAERIATHLDIPKEFISKILQSLTKSNIVISQRGKAGGFRLARLPEKISLMDVVENIDGLGVFSDCLIGHPSCNPEAPCPLHHSWAPLRSQLKHLMEKTHLGNFIPGQTLNQLPDETTV
ncbi:MAG: Rrf2 family transcriptional regulator [Candidatus Marinimicrobia bacterium]|nr:Rrf2 family transcriptional regulator [Candidatus Neomarinimicrobiota bacterium]